MKKKYVVRLTEAERQALEALVRTGTGAASRRTHAQGLLWADEGDHGPGLIDSEVAQTVGVSEKTLWRMRQRCVEEGLEPHLDADRASGKSSACLMETAKRAWLR